MSHLLFLLLSAVYTTSTLVNPPPHALYISTTEIRHTAGSKEAQIRVRIFQDDLRSAVRAYAPASYQPGEVEKWPTHNQAMLKAYFDRHLVLSINHKKAKLVYQTMQVEGEVYWLEFRINSDAHWKAIEVQADYLTELFSEQTNVIQVESAGKKWFGRTSREQPRTQFQLN